MDTQQAFSHLLNELFKGEKQLLSIRLGYAKNTITSYRSRLNSGKYIREETMTKMLQKAGAIHVPGTWIFPDDIND